MVSSKDNGNGLTLYGTIQRRKCWRWWHIHDDVALMTM